MFDGRGGDGLNVGGEVVGAWLGTGVVGTDVGLWEGPRVGVGVGILVGDDVGTCVGFWVGDGVGILVGCGVGC